MADWDRTANHFPSRFTNTSIQTYLPLLSLPLAMLFSVSLPWTTATLPSTFTSIGPFSTDSALYLPDFTPASKLCFVSLLPSYPTPVQSSARIWPILSTSPAFMASVQSCSSCLIACETLGPLAVVATVGAGVSAKASPTPAHTIRTVTTNFFIFLSRMRIHRISVRVCVPVRDSKLRAWIVNRGFPLEGSGKHLLLIPTAPVHF